MTKTGTANAKPDYYPEVASLQPLPGMKLKLAFTDGNQGVADLSDVPKERSDCPWKTQQEFETVQLYNDTAAWRNGSMMIDYSPTDLYVKAGFARWEDILVPANPDRIKIEEASDSGENRIFVRCSTGRSGNVKIANHMLSGEEYTPNGSEATCVAPWRDVLWKNRYEIKAEVLDDYLAKRGSASSGTPGTPALHRLEAASP